MKAEVLVPDALSKRARCRELATQELHEKRTRLRFCELSDAIQRSGVECATA
jgi:hypothetical protein